MITDKRANEIYTGLADTAKDALDTYLVQLRLSDPENDWYYTPANFIVESQGYIGVWALDAFYFIPLSREFDYLQIPQHTPAAAFAYVYIRAGVLAWFKNTGSNTIYHHTSKTLTPSDPRTFAL